MSEEWREVEAEIKSRDWERGDCIFRVTQPEGGKYFYIEAVDDVGCESTLEGAQKLCELLQWTLNNRYRKLEVVLESEK